MNDRADDPESRENVGLKDLRFGVIGLGTCAGLAILVRNHLLVGERDTHPSHDARRFCWCESWARESRESLRPTARVVRLPPPAFAGEDQMAASLLVRSSSASLIVRSLS